MAGGISAGPASNSTGTGEPALVSEATRTGAGDAGAAQVGAAHAAGAAHIGAAAHVPDVHVGAAHDAGAHVAETQVPGAEYGSIGTVALTGKTGGCAGPPATGSLEAGGDCTTVALKNVVVPIT